jgi:hypothetical protein
MAAPAAVPAAGKLRATYRWGPPPEGSQDELAWANQQGRAATFRILLPFALAFLAAVVFRASGGWLAPEELRSLAFRVAAYQSRTDPPLTDHAIARQLSIDLYGPEANEVTRVQYEKLLRAIAHRLRGFDSSMDARRRADALAASALQSLWPFYGFLLLAQLLLVLLFPMLFISFAVHARNEIARWRAQEEAAAVMREDPFLAYIGYRRWRRLLYQEGKLHFWRRAGFAILIVLAVNLIILPMGVRTALLGEYAAMHAAPGELASPFLLRTLAQSDPLVVGLAGYFLYSLTFLVRRFQGGDLSHRMLLPLFNRGMMVILIGLVISGISQDSNMARALVFLVGIFPQAGLQFLSKLAQTNVERLTNDPGAGFRAIPEIDLWKETSLEEMGISNVTDLAKADIRNLIETVGINAKVLLRSIDRALLLDLFGVERATAAARQSIFTATELLLYARGSDSYQERWAGHPVKFPLAASLSETEQRDRANAVAESMGVADISLQLAQLEADHNARFILDNKIMYGHF